MLRKEEVLKEALEHDIDMNYVAEKTRDGRALFDMLDKKYDDDSYVEKVQKKSLVEVKDDMTRGGIDEDYQVVILKAVRPVNSSHAANSKQEEDYFCMLNKHWDSIKRAPTLDVTGHYCSPLDLSTILRPSLSLGNSFAFGKPIERLLHFDLGESFAPVPPITDKEVQKRLKKLMSRLQSLYDSRRKATEGVVNLDMLKSFVDQMKLNEEAINSLESCSYQTPVKPVSPATTQHGSFSRKKQLGAVASCKALVTVKQVRNIYRKSAKHDEWEKKATLLLSWYHADEKSVELSFFALPRRSRPRKNKEITTKEHNYWFSFLIDYYTVDYMNSDIRKELLKKLMDWPRKKFENTRNILEGFWNKCFESEKAWNSLLQSTADDWQPKYPSISKNIFNARLTSDKMLVKANALRIEVEDLITPLLVSGSTKGVQNRSHYCNEESPTYDWPLHAIERTKGSLFSVVPSCDSQQLSAATGTFRRRRGVSLHSSVYEKASKMESTLELGYADSVEGDLENAGKKARGRRKWSAGLGEKEIVSNVGGTAIAGVPPVFTTEVIPVQSAIQWAFQKSDNKFFFLKADIVKLVCDFGKLTAELTCERNGVSNSITLCLDECLKVDSGSVNSAPSTILELNLLDSESYYIVEELKKSKLQLHTALKYNRPEPDILTIIDVNPSCAGEKDFDGKLPLILAIEKGESPKIISAILLLSLPIDLEGNFKEFPGGSFCWIYVLTQTNDKYVDAVTDVLNAFAKDMTHIMKISALTDEFGRKALDVATPKCRRAILSTMYFLGRYELKDGPPEHKSATCLVHLAIDRDNSDMPVALKLMRWRSQFNRELNSRNECCFDSEYVVGILRSYDGEESSALCDELNRKGYGTYRFCIVMPAAERNLAGIMSHEHIAGKDWKKIRQISEELCECITHVHSKGVIHGDIKPLNIVRESGRIKMLDLDACVSFEKKDLCGAKFSSAYLPPEMVHCDLITLKAVVKSFQMDEVTGKAVVDNKCEYSLMAADTSMDAWALGVTLFELCTGEPFFLNNDEDNVDEQNLFALGTFSPHLKREKLKKISHSEARNFVSLLLNVDGRKRLSIPRALQHPFITGRDASRLPGEEAEFDVFISYRVASDSHHAEMLYEMLTGKGLKVWWDKKCLEAGVPWDEGFCHGLIKSFAFLPLLSRNAINNSNDNHCNFEKLQTDSRCDNVYLEHRLALELREMGLIEKIFPVMIGDCVPVGEEDESKNVDSNVGALEYTHYFSSGCHPKKASKEVILTVESTLRAHLENEGLGSPYNLSESPHSVLSQITQNQGAFLVGKLEESLPRIVDTISGMINQHGQDVEDLSSNLNLMREETLQTANVPNGGVGVVMAALKARIESLTKENMQLKLAREGLNNEQLIMHQGIAATTTLGEKVSDDRESSKRGLPLAFSEELAKFDQGIEISPRK